MIRGGNFDVDVRLFSPSGEMLYDGQRKQYDSITFKLKEKGEYSFCFSNEFSSFTHKTIYFDLIDSGKFSVCLVCNHHVCTQELYIFSHVLLVLLNHSLYPYLYTWTSLVSLHLHSSFPICAHGFNYIWLMRLHTTTYTYLIY